MLKLSNPRESAVIENWPFGSKKVTAIFSVEKNNRGERVSRTTTGKPKLTTYYVRCRIVDGDDRRTYVLALTEYGQIVVIPGTLKTATYYYAKDECYGEYKSLLDSTD